MDRQPDNPSSFGRIANVSLWILFYVICEVWFYNLYPSIYDIIFKKKICALVIDSARVKPS
jgi:hypothetical protein